jgi:quercetin dioxygenase-like cupin family protein
MNNSSLGHAPSSRGCAGSEVPRHEAPDGYIGVHHHIGPGIRYVISGELTFAEGGQETIFKAGEYFFDTGNLAHTARNKTNVPLRLLVVEILPKDWTAPAMIAPKSQ